VVDEYKSEFDYWRECTIWRQDYQDLDHWNAHWTRITKESECHNGYWLTYLDWSGKHYTQHCTDDHHCTDWAEGPVALESEPIP